MTQAMPQDTEMVDVLIAGGGHVGLALGLALKRAAPDLEVLLVDATPPGRMPAGRVSAVAAAGRKLLQQLDVWQKIEAEAQPINEMIITDSRTRDVVRPVFLTFSGALAGEPFAHMIANGTMVGAVQEAAGAMGMRLETGRAVASYDVSPASVAIHLDDGRTVTARLLVAADGVRSRLRDLAGIATVGWSYGQSGIVATVTHERPHGGRAEEHFLPGGPFAMLPLTGNRSSLVWTERTEEAERIIADRFVYEVELERRFGHRLGRIESIGEPRAFPLGLTLARHLVRPRLALAGDAAHGIHPIAGQGLNLGFRDVAALAETIVEAHRLGLDIGSLAVLERYERWRRFDAFEMGVVTDVLNRLFSNDNPVLRLVRDTGLGIVERLPGLKNAFIRQAAGEDAGSPRLLRGEAL